MNIIKKIQSIIEKNVKTKDFDESVLVQSNHWVRSITWGLIGTTGFAIAWLAIAKTEEIIVAPGNLVPIGAVKEVQMPMGGVISEILVKDGDRVKANEVLIRLDAESNTQKQKSSQESLLLKKRQLALKKIELTRFQNLNKDAIGTLKVKIEFEKEILERYRQLSKVGASAELQFLQQRNTVQSIEGELRETTLYGLQQQSVLRQQIQGIKSEIAELESNLIDINVTLRYQELLSPVAGIVFDIQPSGPGFIGRGSETLLKIVPFNALEAKVEVPSSKIGFVSTGMNVDLSIDSYPATDFGVLKGKVLQLGSDALPPDPSNREFEFRYPAIIELDNQKLKLNDAKSLTLQPGMSLTAHIKLRKVTYLQLLLGTFKDKTDSLRKI